MAKRLKSSSKTQAKRAATKRISRATAKGSKLSKSGKMKKAIKGERWKPLAKFNPTPRSAAETQMTLASGSPFSSGCSITSQTVATEPANRARLKVGVGEAVILTFSDGNASWSTSGGTLSPPSGNVNSVTWTAPNGAAQSITITAQGTDCSATISFQVVQPTSRKQIQQPPTNVIHTHNEPDSGMYMEIFLVPDDVCFYNVEIIEEECNATDTGVYALMTDKGHHPSTIPTQGTMTVASGLGTLLAGIDKIYSGYPGTPPPFAPGSRTWKIPFNFRVIGTTAWTFVQNTTQLHTLAADGQTLQCSKAGGSSPQFKVSDPTS